LDDGIQLHARRKQSDPISLSREGEFREKEKLTKQTQFFRSTSSGQAVQIKMDTPKNAGDEKAK
jgi:hypothetical protein